MLPILTDICWTLYRSNTTFDFLDWLITDPGYRRLRKAFRHPLMRAANRLIVRLSGCDVERQWALRYLRRYDQPTQERKAQEFVLTVLSSRRIDEAWHIIEGRRVVLATGTIEPIAHAVARLVNAEAVYAGDIYKRALRNDNVNDNDNVDDNDNYDILTDNLSDAPLVRRARRAYIVTYGTDNQWRQLTHRDDLIFIPQHGTRY